MTNVDIQLTLQVTYQKGTTVDENELRTMFQNYGPISDINTNSIGAFIDFKSHNDALTAMSAVNDQLTMKVTLAPGEGERLKLPLEVYAEPKIFVAPISPEWDEEAVRENFGQFGTVSEVVILNKGGAFVKYEKMRQAQDAIAHYTENPVQHPGANRIMKVSLATKKEDLLVRNQQQLMYTAGGINGYHGATVRHQNVTGVHEPMNGGSLYLQQHTNSGSLYPNAASHGGGGMRNGGYPTNAQQNGYMRAVTESGFKQRQVPGGKLFVRVGAPINDEQLLRLFAPFGIVLECALQKDGTGRPKNFGFVNYDSVVSAVQAVKVLHGTVSPDSTVPLDVSIKKGEEHYAEPFLRMPMTKGPDGCNLFVRKIPDTWTEDDLVLRFSPFGEVWSVKINVDPKTGVKKGFGFVSYGNQQHAENAMAQMNGQTFEGRWTLNVSVKVPKATPN